jgi:hypothetical protein
MVDEETAFHYHWCQTPLNLEDVVPMFDSSCCSYVAAGAGGARAATPTDGGRVNDGEPSR